jgi:cell wall-associated NlpC family hydrolase
MRRLTRVMLLLIAGLCAIGPTRASAADNTVIKRFFRGQDANSVGMVAASEDTEIAGPQAIYAGQNGDIFLLDQVNGRILRFDPKGKDDQTRSYELPNDLTPTDLVVTRSHILVWDGNVHALQARGPDDAQTRGLDEISTRDIDDKFTISVFAQMGSQKPDSSTDLFDDNTRAITMPKTPTHSQQAVDSRGEGAVLVDVVTGERPTLVRMAVRREADNAILANLRIEVSDHLGTAEFLEIDKRDRMYVLVENIPSSRHKKAGAFVAAYSPAGSLEKIYDIPLSESVALTRRFVTVSADGDVYFLRTQNGEVDVLGVGARNVRAGSVIDSLHGSASAEPSTEDKKGFIAAVRPLTRQQVVQTAFAFEGVQWRVDGSAYGPDPDTACSGSRRIRRPAYLIGKLGQEVRGVPYCWGCYGSLSLIGTRLGQGALAGNVCTKDAPRPDVVGVDCSAFVSAAWGLSQHFTTQEIPSITDPLSDPWDLKPGDALNKPDSHVVLFLRFTADRKAEVMEAAPVACNGRVCRNVYPLSSLLERGFTPVRFRSLANDTSSQVADAGSNSGESKKTVAPRANRRHHRQH